MDRLICLFILLDISEFINLYDFRLNHMVNNVNTIIKFK